MEKRKISRRLSAFLAVVMLLSVLSPITVYATDAPTNELENVYTEPLSDNLETSPSNLESSATDSEIPSDNLEESSVDWEAQSFDSDLSFDDSENLPVNSVDQSTDSETPMADEEVPTAGSEAVPVSDYATFLSCLKVLESYADSYAQTTGEDTVGLVLNYIRTGVEKYNEDSWALLAGAENTEFVTYVAEQDAINGTNAGGLRDLCELETPNGQTVEFEHMFGALDMGYYNSANADFGSWAGDLVDLMEYSYGKVSGDVETMAEAIRTTYLGIDDPSVHSFGYLDIYGDLDAFYLLNELSGNVTLSELMENYYTAGLTNVSRTAYFLNNRFSGKATQDDVRAALYEVYAGNFQVQLLEAARGLDTQTDLRTATCYAFADYLYDLAKDELIPGEDPEPPVEPDKPDTPGEETGNPYYDVFSSSLSTLAPGITQEIKYAMTADGKQIAYYIATADITRDDVQVYANYKDNTGTSWGFSRVTDQMAAAAIKHSDPTTDSYIANYNPIVGVNADFFNMSNAQPSGALVMEGVVYQEVRSENFFAILKDGTPIIGGAAEWNTYKDQIQEAVGASTMLVKDGELAVTATSDYYTSRAPRTCVGITADNKVVLMALDGRQEPFSTGGSAIEIAQIMLDAGCVIAVNLDGGGSTTFAAKQEGADTVTVVNRPSDGFERAVSSSLMVVSTAVVSNEFDHASVSTELDYMSVGAKQGISLSGVSASGNAAEIPEDAVLTVSDETKGTIENGFFTATALGDVEIQLVLADGTIVGRKALHIVTPDGMYFEDENITAVYGVSMPMPIVVTYRSNPVAASDTDVSFSLSAPEAGTFEGRTFTAAGEDECTIRTTKVTATLNEDSSIIAVATINFFKAGEAVFDFDNATAGDRSLAWNRDVSNSITDDEVTYHIVEPGEEMEVSYVFALDMNNLTIPDNLQDAIPVLAQFLGVSLEETTAWQLLLTLAERVSPTTSVTITVDIDPEMDVDYSNMVFNCECFEVTSVTLDENNRLTLICNWIKRDGPLDIKEVSPICTLSGIKLKAKESAVFDENNQLDVTMSGSIVYDARIRSSQAYNIANSELGKSYGLYPYDNSANLENDKGAGFTSTHCEFSDHFILDTSILNGWVQVGDDGLWAYYVDNQRVTGIQKLAENGGTDEFYYEFNEDGIFMGKVTRIFELDGDLYYAINGEVVTGWRMVTIDGRDNYYFFDPDTGKAVDGEQTIYGYDYVFTNYILTRGALVYSSDGIHYKWAGEWIMNSWVEIDGNKYYAGKAPYGYFITSLQTQIHKYGSVSELGYCLFDEIGVWQEDFSGLYTDDNSDTYLIEKGYLVEGAGLVYLDGYYYYFRTSSSTAVKSRTYWITVTNDLLPAGQYTFDEDGKIINPPETVDPGPTEPEPEVKNGIVQENGSPYYYVDGLLTGAGLIQIDGDYYYVRTSTGEVIHSRTYWVTATNGLLPAGQYTFADDGKLIDPPVTDPDPTNPEPEVKNGIVAENDSLYYYVDGVVTGAGLIQIDGDYYYAKTSNGEIVHSRTYWVTLTNNLLPAKEYTFDDTGKIVF